MFSAMKTHASQRVNVRSAFPAPKLRPCCQLRAAKMLGRPRASANYGAAASPPSFADR